MSRRSESIAEASQAPIERRDRQFEFTADLPRHWHGNDPFITHYFNGLSVMFPEGERFFIDSVRHYRDRISDPVLQEQVRGFIGQEAMHSREHKRYNELLDEQGYEVHILEKRLKNILAFVRKHLSPKSHLAITCALEHFTAIMADIALRDPRLLEGAHPVYQDLWRWHAAEETEHKAVAFDVYRSVFPGVRGYITRVHAMVRTTFLFLLRSAIHHVHLLRRDGELWNLRGWARAMYWFWISPGIFRRMLPAYFAYYRPGFHPWQHDNSGELERWKRGLTPVSV